MDAHAELTVVYYSRSSVHVVRESHSKQTLNKSESICTLWLHLEFSVVGYKCYSHPAMFYALDAISSTWSQISMILAGAYLV